MILLRRCCLLALLVSISTTSAFAQRREVPQAQNKPPGPALTPEEARARMVVPEGFSVEIVAAEPRIANPVAMFIDEKGRYWITESFEYPRADPGRGRDRIKVLEDTDGDGMVDKATIFAEGLNIPSGIAVGYGGVWVANSPDLLFLQDTDGDLVADTTEVVLTGFGRTDLHELPNSFTWGPDGWLYGLNGVFNISHVTYAEGNPNYRPDHPGWDFTCALWRVHPRTREFQVFCEGTSNPWGLAVNDEGDFFVSACVIDHLWHLVETGYYIRQGGPYPPHTWPIRSIVEHKHQKAAYCGITWFDSAAYPEEYRKVLYMGNIHGGCINADVLQRNGSTYKGTAHPGFPAPAGAFEGDEHSDVRKIGDGPDARLADLLTANDAWFMPVVQKTGPDGCLYVLDWYDMYHCYQDARADPDGIDRTKGRLYRIRYKETPHAQPFDLAQKSDDELIELLGDPNVYRRDTAQRLLSERGSPVIAAALETLVLDPATAPLQRMHALWAWAGTGQYDSAFLRKLCDSPDTRLRGWGLRLLSNHRETAPDAMTLIGDAFLQELSARDPVVLLQGVIALGRSSDDRAMVGILMAAATSPHDELISRIAWRNLQPLLQRDPQRLLTLLNGAKQHEQPWGAVAPLVLRALELYCDDPAINGALTGRLAAALLGDDQQESHVRRQTLRTLVDRIRQRALTGERLAAARAACSPALAQLSESGDRALGDQATLLRASWGDADAMADVRRQFQAADLDDAHRVEALQTLIAAGDRSVLTEIDTLLTSRSASPRLREEVIASLGALDDAAVAAMLLDHYVDLDPALQTRAIDVLTQRPAWAGPLLAAVAQQRIPKEAINVNQLRRIASFKDPAVQQQFAAQFGAVRDGRNPVREQVVSEMRKYLQQAPADPHRGVAVFKKLCAQCHKIHGEGAEVGPDITLNGRNNWDQLISNVFDPSLVIGPGYQAKLLITTDGRVLTGLAVEESDAQVVLKLQGGKTETIPRSEIDEYKTSEVSLMPEQIENQISRREIADLMSFLALDKPPSDPSATYLPGAPRPRQ